MQKLFNYLRLGQGIGAKFLFVWAVIMSIFIAIYIRVAGAEGIPYVQSVADEMLPIRIENGIVVEPADTYKQARLKLDDYSDTVNLPIVIDTRSNTLDADSLRDGIYLSRTTLYTVNNNQVRITKLGGDFSLPRADYREDLKTLLNWTAVITGIFCIAILFLFYFILTLFYAWCLIAVAKFAKKSLDFDSRMRISSVSIVATYILFVPLNMLNLGSSRLLFFIVVIVLQALFVSRLPDNLVHDTPSITEPPK